MSPHKEGEVRLLPSFQVYATCCLDSEGFLALGFRVESSVFGVLGFWDCKV